MYYRIALIIEDAIYQFSLKKRDVITMGSSSKESICVPELQEIVLKFQWVGSPLMGIKSFPLWKKEPLKPNQIVFLETRKKAAIVVNEINTEFQRLSMPIPVFGQITVGREEDNDICIKDKYVSRHHFAIHCNGKRIEIEDLQSRNHTYINGKMVKKKFIRLEDHIEIINTTFSICNCNLIIENIHNTKNTPIIVLKKREEQFLPYEDEGTISKYDGFFPSYEDEKTISKYDRFFPSYEDEKTISKYDGFSSKGPLFMVADLRWNSGKETEKDVSKSRESKYTYSLESDSGVKSEWLLKIASSFFSEDQPVLMESLGSIEKDRYTAISRIGEYLNAVSHHKSSLLFGSCGDWETHLFTQKYVRFEDDSIIFNQYNKEKRSYDGGCYSTEIYYYYVQVKRITFEDFKTTFYRFTDESNDSDYKPNRYTDGVFEGHLRNETGQVVFDRQNGRLLMREPFGLYGFLSFKWECN